MKKILIIEDEVTIAELEKDYLEFEGYQVDIGKDGLTGLKMAKTKVYDLIILDLMLPGMNGFDIMKEIRGLMNIPMLMVSSRKEDFDIIRGFGLGANDYITKPFSPGQLVARVKAHLSNYERLVKEESTPLLTIRNLSIDHEAREVTIGDEPVQLTVTEYDLLYFLANHPNKVFSKEQLLDQIWGIDYFGDGATVTVHIGKLRDKIDKHATTQTPFFETVWGAGYRFRV